VVDHPRVAGFTVGGFGGVHQFVGVVGRAGERLGEHVQVHRVVLDVVGVVSQSEVDEVCPASGGGRPGVVPIACLRAADPDVARRGVAVDEAGLVDGREVPGHVPDPGRRERPAEVGLADVLENQRRLVDVDVHETTLVFEYVGETDLRGALTPARVRDVARHLATIHEAGFVHGDPTTRNVRVSGPEASDRDDAGTATAGGRTYFIDFGLGYYTDDVEDYAMDLHVFAQSLAGTTDDADELMDAAEAAYRETGDSRVVDHLREIEGRGRYQ